VKQTATPRQGSALLQPCSWRFAAASLLRVHGARWSQVNVGVVTRSLLCTVGTALLSNIHVFDTMFDVDGNLKVEH
jgi:hypothetical protein